MRVRPKTLLHMSSYLNVAHTLHHTGATVTRSQGLINFRSKRWISLIRLAVRL